MLSVAAMTAGVASPLLAAPSNVMARADPRTFLDFTEIDGGSIVAAHTRGFQRPAPTPADEQEGALYWVRALGLVVEAEDDVAPAFAGSYHALPAWYVADQPSMTLRGPSESSLGGQVVGDGAQAWYWDVEDAEEDDVWSTFGIGCTAVWADRRLLLLWGCTAVGNPVEQLIDLASSAYEHWDDTAASLVPSLEELPAGIVLVDDVALPHDLFPAHGTMRQAATPTAAVTSADSPKSDHPHATPSSDVPANADDLRSLLPDASMLPVGFDAGEDSERDLAEMVEALGGSRSAEQLLKEWGWIGNVERSFTLADPAATGLASATNTSVSISGFKDGASAAEALPFFSDILANNGYEDAEAPDLGEQARMLRQVQEDGGVVVALYVQSANVLCRVGGYAPAGDPSETVINIATAMFDG